MIDIILCDLFVLMLTIPTTTLVDHFHLWLAPSSIQKRLSSCSANTLIPAIAHEGDRRVYGFSSIRSRLLGDVCLILRTATRIVGRSQRKLTRISAFLYLELHSKTISEVDSTNKKVSV